MFWPEDKNGGWWPWEHPETMADMADTRCRAKCDWLSDSSNHEDVKNADAVLFHGPHAGGMNPNSFTQKYGKRDGMTFWLFTAESNSNYPIQKDENFLKNIDHKMNYELDSSVPMTYGNRIWLQSWYMLNKNKRTDADAIFVSSNCAPQNQRLVWVREIMKHIRVHSYGACEHNKDWEGDSGQDSRKKLALQGSYKFCLSFDNTDQKDYVSEKFFHALASGCLPVYMGAPNIEEYLPSPEAAILTKNFESPEKLAEHLKYLLDNEEEYNKRLAWKGGGVDGDGVKQGEERMTKIQYMSFATGPCRLCEFLAGADSERNATEQAAMYNEAVTNLVRMEPWKRYHDKEGPETLGLDS